MDVDWRSPNAPPPRFIYRVVMPGQWTQIHKDVGLVSMKRLLSNVTPQYSASSTSQLLNFLHSLRDHRQQRPAATIYISFFENQKEAIAWCHAAKSFHGANVDARLMMVDTQVLDELERNWFRIADVVEGCRYMGWEDPESELGMSEGQKTSEVLVCGYVPWEAVVGGKDKWVDQSAEQEAGPEVQTTAPGLSHAFAPPGQQAIKTAEDYLNPCTFENPGEIGSCGCPLNRECKHFSWSVCERWDEEYRYREKMRVAKEKKSKAAKALREKKRRDQKANESLRAEVLRKEWAASGKPNLDGLLGSGSEQQ